MNVAKASLHFRLGNPSAEADGNKSGMELKILPFTLVNGSINCQCLKGFNPIPGFLKIYTNI